MIHGFDRALRAAFLLVAIAAIVAIAALGAPALARAAPAGASRTDWPQSRRDAQNTASIRVDAPSSGSPRAWSFDGSGRTWGYEPGMTVWSPPAIGLVGGRALFAIGSYDKNIYCLDAATGELIYRFTTGGRVYSAPAIFGDGSRSWLYVASSDRLVYALDAATGRQLWVHSVEPYRPTLGGARLSSPAIAAVAGRNVLFVGRWVWDRSLASSLQRAGVSALDASTGKPIWTQELGDNEITSPVVASIDGRAVLFAGSSSGVLFALDAENGAILWRHVEHDAIKSPPALVETPEGALVVLGSKFGEVRALDARTGSPRWSFKTNERVTGSPAVLAWEGAQPIVAVGSYDRALYALEPSTGRMIWRYQARGGVYSSPAGALDGKDAMVLVSAWDHALHAVSARDGTQLFSVFTGRPLWEVSGMDASTWSSPIAARINGRWIAYAGGYDGTLRALPLDAEAREPPARSNVVFWGSFPLAIAPLAALAIFLTRRDRRRRAGGAQR